MIYQYHKLFADINLCVIIQLYVENNVFRYFFHKIETKKEKNISTLNMSQNGEA